MSVMAIITVDFFTQFFYNNTGRNRQISRGKFVVKKTAVCFTRYPIADVENVENSLPKVAKSGIVVDRTMVQMEAYK